MIKLQKISLPEVKKLIEISYEGDSELMQKYHVAPNMQYWDCVDKTMEMMNDVSKIRKLTNYKIIYKKKPIGYVTISGNLLYSFGVNIQVRNKEFLIKWWGVVVKLFKERFFIMLLQNNTRTIGFLLKNNMQISSFDNENNAITLIYESKLN